jgi:putative membrane protein
LQQLADEKGVQLPARPEPAQESERAKLEKLKRDTFESVYSAYVASDDKKDISTLKSEEKKTGDQDLRAYASQTLPSVQQQEQQARAVNAAYLEPGAATAHQQQFILLSAAPWNQQGPPFVSTPNTR